jgi:hypothetical protein
MPPRRLSAAGTAALDRRAARNRASRSRLTRRIQAYRDATNVLDDLLLVVERLLHILKVRGEWHPYAGLFDAYRDASVRGETARCRDFGDAACNARAVAGYQRFRSVVAHAEAYDRRGWWWRPADAGDLWAGVGDAADEVVRTIRRAGAAHSTCGVV